MVVEARFFNPYSTKDGSWDYGFVFRRSILGQFDVVTVASDGTWKHYLRIKATGESDELVDSGYLSSYSVNFDTATQGSNRLKLVAVGGRGWLFVNGQHVGSLKLGASSPTGDVAVVTGYFRGNQVGGAVTAFNKFTVTAMSKRYGPKDGSLVQQEGLIAVYSSGVAVKNAVAEARFFNPNLASKGSWSYGFLVRSQDDNTFDAVFVRSNQNWYHLSRSGSVESSVELASSYLYGLDTTLRGSNHLLVVAVDEEGWLFVNGAFVAKLNLGVYGGQGDVQASAGYFKDDEIPGNVTRFQDFTVWTP
jgi:hypothetical protein